MSPLCSKVGRGEVLERRGILQERVLGGAVKLIELYGID